MSAASRATGAAPNRRRNTEDKDSDDSRRGKGTPRRAGDGPLAVRLEHARWRHFGWAVFSVTVGVLLLMNLGTVGKVVGVALLVGALPPARAFAMTLIHQPGEIRIDGTQAQLPRGLCRPNPVTVPIDAVHHAFFLRRAVPWTRTGPLLVVEAADRVFTYPRDWFATESDQRRVVDAISRRPADTAEDDAA